MFKQDWVMQQINTLARSIAFLVFHKEDTAFLADGTHPEIEDLYRRLLERVNAGEIGRAEDMLFEACDEGELCYLELAVDFYTRLNALSDQQLAAGGFGRDEVQEGLADMAARYGVCL